MLIFSSSHGFTYKTFNARSYSDLSMAYLKWDRLRATLILPLKPLLQHIYDILKMYKTLNLLMSDLYGKADKFWQIRGSLGVRTSPFLIQLRPKLLMQRINIPSLGTIAQRLVYVVCIGARHTLSEILD